MSAARRFFLGVGAVLALLSPTGCVEGLTANGGPTSDFIVISDFALPQGVVRLDPSFGFSLYRGEPGVPAQQRAASIGRAVGFLVTDTITDQLRALGYDAVSTTDPAPKIGARALIVTGTFREVNEGERRRPDEVGSAVIADVQIKAEVPGLAGLQPVQSFSVDSRSAPSVGAPSAATPRETGVNADAARVGSQIAAVVAEVARRNNWAPMKH
ncbi:MAG TPA: hypothetical protein VGR70_19400 [Stellaceae bacterium]|nr:hypothetical protein [Stellaceae bacterium]